jgi:thymidine phosphorylase
MTNSGVFFFVVGPSGVGKDTLIDGAKAALAHDPDFVFATRTITRPSGAPGEAHVGVTAEEFAALDTAQRFLITWQAHGLHYGLPVELKDALARGQHVIANGSRAVIGELAGRVARFVVIEVSALASALAARIAERGRETEAEIAARLARSVAPTPAGVVVSRVVNDSSIEVGVARFIAALRDAANQYAGCRTSEPASASAYRAKLAGVTLDETGYAALIDDLSNDRYSSADSREILRTLISQLQDKEFVALARFRARRMPRIDWNEPIVVDKHSMGGVPGSRITPIVVPIIAAHGLLMPKTSSRAITSASGTADAMEAAARVDLDAAEMRRVVEATRGCIVWNGRLNHSQVDDVTNAMVRPLGLDTRRWSVASILSKKYSAGATHVVVDLPFGPQAKLKTEEEARGLGDLFERVGAELGLTVRAFATDGRAPIGRGIGPALELRDVLQVLNGDADAPGDLREKALTFAGRILAWDPQIADVEQGRFRAEQLLASGAARQTFARIVEAQGRREFALPSPFVATVRATHSGTVSSIDGWRVSGLAIEAGAPGCKGAGVDLLCRVGMKVAQGDPLLRIHAADDAHLMEATRVTAQCAGIGIDADIPPDSGRAVASGRVAVPE